MGKKFIRKKEDFTCEHCGESVVGDGYTNHCPKCLWGKHVDVYPGDRMSTCKGLMKPIGVEIKKGGEFTLIQECVKCKHTKRNIFSKLDDMALALSIEEKQKSQI